MRTRAIFFSIRGLLLSGCVVCEGGFVREQCLAGFVQVTAVYTINNNCRKKFNLNPVQGLGAEVGVGNNFVGVDAL